MASGSIAAPKSIPPRGIPPKGPHSMERVKRSESPSSWATEPIPPGIPMPRLMREPGRSSMAARRQQIFRGPMTKGSKPVEGTFARPAISGRKASVAKLCRLYFGFPSTT